MDVYYVKLRAINPEKNVDRTYEIMLQQTIFRSWSVVCKFGRWGSRGEGGEVVREFTNKDNAEDFFIDVLKKRLSSKGRIGVNYSVIEIKKK